MRLIDVWRVLNPSGRNYTYYSPLHKMYSRLDLFLISHHLLTWHPEVEIASPIWSDHAPVYFSIKLKSIPILLSVSVVGKLMTIYLRIPSV